MKVYIVSMLWGIMVGKILYQYINTVIQEEGYVYGLLFIQLLTGACFTIIYFQYGWTIKTLLGWTFTVFAIVLARIDWYKMILPTSIIKRGAIIGLIERIVQVVITENGMLLVDALIGAIIGYLFFMSLFYGSLWFLKKEGMGYGDVRLMGFIGLYTGLNTLFLAILIGSILASIYGSIRLVFQKKSEAYPLGPFLNIGGWMALIWGEKILSFTIERLNYL